MPQTREHFDICRLLGLERGLIVLTKADLRRPRRPGDRVARSARAGGGQLSGRRAARRDVGADRRRPRRASSRRWPSLAGRAPRQARHGVVRLPVDRVFTMKGFGTVVTGTLVSGDIRAGQDLVVLPEGRVVRVRGRAGARPRCHVGQRAEPGRGQSRFGRRARSRARRDALDVRRAGGDASRGRARRAVAGRAAAQAWRARARASRARRSGSGAWRCARCRRAPGASGRWRPSGSPR